MATDDDLFERYRRGEAAAFAMLYERHKRVVFGYLLRVLGERMRAEDVHQETWLQVVQLADRYRPGGAFKTWLFTLARSRCMDRLRRERVRAVESGADLAALDGPSAAAAANNPDHTVDAYSLVAGVAGPPEIRQQQELAEILRRVIAKLPAAQREVFLLHDEADLSLVEVAAVLGIAYEAAKSRYRYALARLRAELTASGLMDE